MGQPSQLIFVRLLHGGLSLDRRTPGRYSRIRTSGYAIDGPGGFPSPAADYYEERLSLDDHLIEHKEATFFVRVQGHSMTGFGIHDGDLLLVDRALDPHDRNVVIAVVDSGFTVKQLCRIPNGILLRSGNPGHADILVSEGQSLEVWGVVRWAIHKVV